MRTRIKVKHSVGAATLLYKIVNQSKPTWNRQHPPNPHTRKAGDTHKCQKNSPRFGTCKAQNAGDNNLVNIRLAQCRGYGETSYEKHDSWVEHDRKDISRQDKWVAEKHEKESYTDFVASGVDNRKDSFSSRMTRSAMRRTGTLRDVTKSGIAWNQNTICNSTKRVGSKLPLMPRVSYKRPISLSSSSLPLPGRYSYSTRQRMRPRRWFPR